MDCDENLMFINKDKISNIPEIVANQYDSDSCDIFSNTACLHVD